MKKLICISNLKYGFKLIDEMYMYAEGIPSPVDNASPPRMYTNLFPSKFGCWVPPDSPFYDTVDCGLGDQVNDFKQSKYMLTMQEMVDNRKNMSPDSCGAK
jgi:hypothetical protein